MADFRVLVTGSRDWRDWRAIFRALDDIHADHPDLTVVHGDCPTGADKYADDWAALQHAGIDPHPADWDAPCRAECKAGHRRPRRHGSIYCPAAGNYRNQEMVDTGPAVCLAFFQPGAANTGTSDCVRRAIAAGITVAPYGDVPRSIQRLPATPARRFEP